MGDRHEERQEPLHELNNQLTVILGFADLLLEGMLADDPRRPDVLEIRDAAIAALALIPSLR